MKRNQFLWGLGGLLWLSGCGGGSSVTPGDASSDLAGNYSAQISVDSKRSAVLVLSIKDGSGTASGFVYVFDETATATAAVNRHLGHPIIASGSFSGQVNPTARTFSFSVPLTNKDATTTPGVISGTVLRFGVDHGSVILQIGAETFTSVFQ